MPEWLNIFNANADPSDPTSSAALALRQRIALGLMEKKRAYPKTFGEGLAAIGDSLGEIGMSRQLVAQQAAVDKAMQAEKAGVNKGAGPQAAAEPQTKVADEPLVDEVKTAQASVFPDPSTAQPSIPQSMVAQLGPAAASAAPPVSPTSIAAPRDKIANLLANGSDALNGPEVSQLNPTQPGPTAPTNLPLQVASLGGPPEAAGNRPIQSDVQPASQLMQVAQQSQQYRPPPIAPRQPTDAPITLPAPQTSSPLPAQPGAAAWDRPTRPTLPKQVDKSPDQVTFEQRALSHPFQEMREFYKGQAALLEAQRAQRQKEVDAQFASDLAKYNTQDSEWIRAHQSLPQTQETLKQERYKTQQQQEQDQRRAVYGDLPPHVHEYLTESKKNTALAVAGLEGLRNAREVIDAGTLFGVAAPAKLLYYQLRAEAGDKDAARIVAATQTYKTSLGPMAAQAIKSYGGAQISNEDRRQGMAMSGADYTLDEKSARRMLDIAERSAIAKINEHRGDLDNLLKTQPPTLRRLYDVPDPLTAMPAEKAAAPPSFTTMQEAEQANLPRGTKIIVGGKRFKVQ
jgi:hypothetical protein